MTKPLSEKEIKSALTKESHWIYNNKKLTRSIEFKSHLEAMSFLNAVAFYSEKTCHHPAVQFCYHKVELNYQTHDAGNKVTRKDLEAAFYIESLLN